MHREVGLRQVQRDPCSPSARSDGPPSRSAAFDFSVQSDGPGASTRLICPAEFGRRHPVLSTGPADADSTRIDAPSRLFATHGDDRPAEGGVPHHRRSSVSAPSTSKAVLPLRHRTGSPPPQHLARSGWPRLRHRAPRRPRAPGRRDLAAAPAPDASDPRTSPAPRLPGPAADVCDEIDARRGESSRRGARCATTPRDRGLERAGRGGRGRERAELGSNVGVLVEHRTPATARKAPFECTPAMARSCGGSSRPTWCSGSSGFPLLLSRDSPPGWRQIVNLSSMGGTTLTIPGWRILDADTKHAVERAGDHLAGACIHHADAVESDCRHDRTACASTSHATSRPCAAALRQAVESEGVALVGVLINNAGYEPGGAFETTPMEDVRRQFETNVRPHPSHACLASPAAPARCEVVNALPGSSDASATCTARAEHSTTPPQPPHASTSIATTLGRVPGLDQDQLRRHRHPASSSGGWRRGRRIKVAYERCRPTRFTPPPRRSGRHDAPGCLRAPSTRWWPWAPTTREAYERPDAWGQDPP